MPESPSDFFARYPLGSTVSYRGAEHVVMDHDTAADGCPVLVCVRYDPRERATLVTPADTEPPAPSCPHCYGTGKQL